MLLQHIRMRKLIISLVVAFPIFLCAQKSKKLEENRILSEIDSTQIDNMVLIQTLEVNVPLQKVWDAYTTKTGWQSWIAPVVEIDFKIGGTIQANYTKTAKIGDPGTTQLHIINYIPNSLITLQAELTDNFPAFMKEDSTHLYNIIQFETIKENKTRIISYGLGYKKNKEYLKLMNFFITANETSFMQLITYLETGKPKKF